MSPPQATDVVIIGGGVAGLAAAHHLRQHGKSIVLIEENSRPGGRAWTALIDDTPVELGAAFISDFYASTMRLVDELGLTGSLTRRSQTAYVLRGTQPEGIWPAPQLINGRALPLLAKLRLAGLAPALLRHWRSLDISDLPKIAYADRESAAAFAERAIGKEDAEYFFTPLLRSLLYWDPESTSAAVVWCILKAFATSKATYRLAGGMREMVDALASGIDVVSQAKATGIAQASGGGFAVSASVAGADALFQSRQVLCATPAPAASSLADWLPRPLHDFLSSVTYTSTGILTYRVTESADYPRGAYLFPASSVPDLTSVNPLYQYEDAGPGDSQERLLNVCLSDSGAREYASLSDEELGDRVLHRLSEVLGAAWVREAKHVYTQRWPLAIPRFNVGYIRATEQFLATRKTVVPGLAFAGDYLGGPYIDGAIASGIRAAQDLLEHSPTPDLQ
jgi:oxygen-dependent protoporphyrinogen oxidase